MRFNFFKPNKGIKYFFLVISHILKGVSLAIVTDFNESALVLIKCLIALSTIVESLNGNVGLKITIKSGE